MSNTPAPLHYIHNKSTDQVAASASTSTPVSSRSGTRVTLELDWEDQEDMLDVVTMLALAKGCGSYDRSCQHLVIPSHLVIQRQHSHSSHSRSPPTFCQRKPGLNLNLTWLRPCRPCPGPCPCCPYVEGPKGFASLCLDDDPV